MLSEIIKKRLEERAGFRVRYTRDCRTLAEKISSESGCHISASTIQRLFGFVKGIKEPRAYTLDIIAVFLGHEDWERLLSSFNTDLHANEKVIHELKASKLRAGEKFQLTYKPDSSITIEYLGNQKFKVLGARNSRLSTDDVFKVSVITVHHPLFLLDVESKANKEGRLLEARVSGITSIKKL